MRTYEILKKPPKTVFVVKFRLDGWLRLKSQTHENTFARRLISDFSLTAYFTDLPSGKAVSGLSLPNPASDSVLVFCELF